MSRFRANSLPVLLVLLTAGCVGLPVEEAASEPTIASTEQAVTAQVGAWNSCYEDTWYWTNWTPAVGTFCMEQWGSFPASCGSAPNGSGATVYQAGTRCKNTSKVLSRTTLASGAELYYYDCRYGSFNNYNTYYSWYWNAGTYTCDETPSASNVSLSYDSSSGNFTGAYTYSQAGNGPEGVSTYEWQYSPTGSSSNTTTVGHAKSVNINTVFTQMPSQYRYSAGYLRFCVKPVLDTTFFDGSNSSGSGADVSGSQTCSDWTYWASLWSGTARVSTTQASGVSTSFQGAQSIGSYTYNLSDTDAEGTSTYRWYRASDSTGTGRTAIVSKTYEYAPNPVYAGGAGYYYENTQSRALETSDDNSYLEFCVTEKSGSTTGTESCSAYTAVGRLVELYKDNLSNINLNFAYERFGSGTCFNLSDYGFNDELSSFVWAAPSGSSATLQLFQDANCSGSMTSRTLAAGQSESMYSMKGTLGSSWNDSVSSFRVIHDDVVSVSNVAIAVSGNKATGSYTFSSSSSLSESGSSYVIQRADDANGTNATTLTTSSSWTLATADNAKYVRFCVTPSDGFASGSQSCSGWTSVGHLTEFWKDNFSGTNLNIAYENSPSGTCFNMSTYSFNDVMSSLVFNAPANWGATLWVYQDANCSGSSATLSQAAGTTLSMYSMHASMGSSWNDSVSSIKVTY